MYKNTAQNLIFSPSDLTLFVESRFASYMERFNLEQPDWGIEPDPEDEMLSVLSERGLRHEQELLETFRQGGLLICDMTQYEKGRRIDETQKAMGHGVDVIYQAELADGNFRGSADFLIKLSTKSVLGEHSYEVWDAKLANQLKPYFIIQLCCYTEMLERIQGNRSETISVILGSGEVQQLRTNDYYFYYQSIKNQFLKFQSQFDIKQAPDPADSKDYGRWTVYAESLLAQRDHLSQVATITRNQIKRLEAQGITSCHDLVSTSKKRIIGLNADIFQRLKKQAAIQIESRGLAVPKYEVIIPPTGERLGLALLPPHSDRDVFFDIEGYPLEQGGLEYLWGNTYFDEKGERQFKDFWAHDHNEEKQAFIEFIQWVYGRWQSDPTMHIYHYANYEIAACRKLMGRYGVCEHEVDQLLRNEVFVDLYKIVKQSLLLGEPRYSIKNVEHLYRGKRETTVGTGGDSVVVYENWRNHRDGDNWQTSEILNNIRDYNIDDCNSTQELVDWLRQRLTENHIAYLGKTELVEPDISEEITERIALRDRLLQQSEQESSECQAILTENMAWMLEFHRREAKPVFWRLFDRLGMDHEELLEDIDCIAYCQRTKRPAFKATPRARYLSYEYRFDANQEFKEPRSMSLYLLGEDNEKVSLDKEESCFKEGKLVVKSKVEPPVLISLIPDDYVRPDPIPQSIESVVRNFEQHKDFSGALMDFLRRNTPRINHHNGGAIVTSSEPTEQLKEIIQAIKNLSNSYLTIQGPPGAGKTYTGKHVIAELIKTGKTVAISSNSHKAINNLLIGTAEHLRSKSIKNRLICTKDTGPELEALGIDVLKNAELADGIEPGCVIGTTAWGFSRDDLAGQFDYLFVDEAGQVSVANLIGMSRCCRNMILMGDQMQLGQPIQGSHPKDSGLSILDYLLHEQATISDDMGVFLGTTYRMHSKVNEFISEAIYEGKLHSALENDRQTIQVPKSYHGPLTLDAGVQFIPVKHEGNTQASEEEVAQIKGLAKELIGRLFTDKDQKKRTIDWNDMLFVAPYNHQVNQLQYALGEQAKVGSVDKFQGQEAPIVFLSMCASDANDSPRGIDFLFDIHRINVAISRAQTLAIVVGNPGLFSTSANNIEQMKKINVFSRLHSYVHES